MSFPAAINQRKKFERRILSKSVDIQAKTYYHNTFCTSVLLLAFDHYIGQFFIQDVTYTSLYELIQK